VTALRKSEPGDALVLWLRSEDIAALGPPPAKAAVVFMSGRMGGLDQSPLPAAWRSVTHMAYPFELPDRRRIAVTIRSAGSHPANPGRGATDAGGHLSRVRPRVGYAQHMVDTFVRDYLVERIEEMLDTGSSPATTRDSPLRPASGSLRRAGTSCISRRPVARV